MVKCKIDIETNEECVFCCRYCSDDCNKRCIMAKRNCDCNNEIRDKSGSEVKE